jgi:hypothetical protein
MADLLCGNGSGGWGGLGGIDNDWEVEDFFALLEWRLVPAWSPILSGCQLTALFGPPLSQNNLCSKSSQRCLFASSSRSRLTTPRPTFASGVSPSGMASSPVLPPLVSARNLSMKPVPVPFEELEVSALRLLPSMLLNRLITIMEVVCSLERAEVVIESRRPS